MDLGGRAPLDDEVVTVMNMHYESFSDARIKHLEMIQAVIARLGNDGFLVKGWSVTIVGAFVGFAVNNDKWGLALAGIAPALVFWGLDALFLRSERLFRELYSCVQEDRGDLPAFFMAATGPMFADLVKKQGKTGLLSWPRTAARRALVVFYLALIAGAGAAAVVLHCG